MGTDIAVNRISCKPQKLQAMLATVEIGRGGRRHGDWQGMGMTTPRAALDGSGSAAVFRQVVLTERYRRAVPAAAAGRLASGMTSAYSRIPP
jgi:hypothetical protein